jgi:hypothetical protein
MSPTARTAISAQTQAGVLLEDDVVSVVVAGTGTSLVVVWETVVVVVSVVGVVAVVVVSVVVVEAVVVASVVVESVDRPPVATPARRAPAAKRAVRLESVSAFRTAQS